MFLPVFVSCQRIFNTNYTNYFYAVRISISLAILSEIFIQLVIFSKSYARKQKWVFFSEQCSSSYQI